MLQSKVIDSSIIDLQECLLALHMFYGHSYKDKWWTTIAKDGLGEGCPPTWGGEYNHKTQVSWQRTSLEAGTADAMELL